MEKPIAWLAWNSLFMGGIFMLFIGLGDLGRPGYQRPGIVLTALGGLLAVASFFMVRRAFRRGRPDNRS